MTGPYDVVEGQELPSLTKNITRTQIFRYSAVTWNTHRIHFDLEFARQEGYPDVLVQQHFHGAVIQEQILKWVGAHGTITELEWRNINWATPDDLLHAEATIAEVDNTSNTIEIEVSTRTDYETCTKGCATVLLD